MPATLRQRQALMETWNYGELERVYWMRQSDVHRSPERVNADLSGDQLGLSGLSQATPGKRAKSVSALQTVRPCSMAIAARWASGTRLPVACARSSSRPRMRA